MTSGFLLQDVSRETRERLDIYLDLLRKWSPRINLVSKATLSDAWARHFEDSAQLLGLSSMEDGTWLDMGSGGGFPGLVIAILLEEQAAKRRVVLMESDQRKCAFLRTVIRETAVNAEVITNRIEVAPPAKAVTISARALSNLSELLEFTCRHGTEKTEALFSKGRTWQSELSEARSKWRFKHEVYHSNTDPEAVILRIEEIEHV